MWQMWCVQTRWPTGQVEFKVFETEKAAKAFAESQRLTGATASFWDL